jgi:hypothetical protein
MLICGGGERVAGDRWNGCEGRSVLNAPGETPADCRASFQAACRMNI